MNTAIAPPTEGRLFYSIQYCEDGTADVYLMPFEGVRMVVPGVDPWDGEVANPSRFASMTESQTTDGSIQRIEPLRRLEDDIRARYYAWCESAEIIRNGGD